MSRAEKILRALVAAQDALLICYRLGDNSLRDGNAADRCRKLRESLARLDAEAAASVDIIEPSASTSKETP